MTGYEARARRIAGELGLWMRIKEGEPKCPPWDDARHVHGVHYRVTLHKGRRLTFSFWGSHHNMERGVEPGYYDVLPCVASDASGPIDPDEAAEEYGPMRPSQAVAMVRWTKRLQRFFSGEEIEALTKIDA